MRQMISILPMLALLCGCVDIPDNNGRRQSVRQSTTTYSPKPEARQCLADLGSTRANFTPLPDRYFGGGCSTLNSVQLASLRSDYHTLAVSNLGPVTCPMANTFAAWARYGVDRAARQILGPNCRTETPRPT